MAQTSDRVSSKAANLANIKGGDIFAACNEGSAAVDRLVRDIRAVAASALRQDERPGLFKRIFKGG